MIPKKSGVIMTVTALPARMGTTLNGGYGPAMAAKEALTRDLSAELAPHGIRVVGLRPHGIPETATMKRSLRDSSAKALGMTWEQFTGFPRKQDPSATGHDARGGGKHGGLHGVRQGERDDGNDRQLVHGRPGRLAARPGHRCQRPHAGIAGAHSDDSQRQFRGFPDSGPADCGENDEGKPMNSQQPNPVAAAAARNRGRARLRAVTAGSVPRAWPWPVPSPTPCPVRRTRARQLAGSAAFGGSAPRPARPVRPGPRLGLLGQFRLLGAPRPARDSPAAPGSPPRRVPAARPPPGDPDASRGRRRARRPGGGRGLAGDRHQRAPAGHRPAGPGPGTAHAHRRPRRPGRGVQQVPRGLRDRGAG